jgi:hypothetical protein
MRQTPVPMQHRMLIVAKHSHALWQFDVGHCFRLAGGGLVSPGGRARFNWLTIRDLLHLGS